MRGRRTGSALLAAAVGFLVLAVAAPAHAQLAGGGAPPRAWTTDVASAQADEGSYAWTGAAVGALVGAGATWVVLHQGGSTSLCDRDANQDAMNAGECAALTAGGALLGAGLGWLLGSRLRREGGDASPNRLRLRWAPGRAPTLAARLVL